MFVAAFYHQCDVLEPLDFFYFIQVPVTLYIEDY